MTVQQKSLSWLSFFHVQTVCVRSHYSKIQPSKIQQFCDRTGTFVLFSPALVGSISISRLSFSKNLKDATNRTITEDYLLTYTPEHKVTPPQIQILSPLLTLYLVRYKLNRTLRQSQPHTAKHLLQEDCFILASAAPAAATYIFLCTQAHSTL